MPDQRLLFVGGPNHGWLQTGEEAQCSLFMFNPDENGAEAVGTRTHTYPRYYPDLLRQYGNERVKEWEQYGFRFEYAVYRLESIGDPCIARFLGWYSELHDEHGKHIDGSDHDHDAPA